MNEHDATEQAFKNGYKKGVEDLAERVKKYYSFLSGIVLCALLRANNGEGE